MEMNDLREGMNNSIEYLKLKNDLIVLKDFLSIAQPQFKELEIKKENAIKEYNACVSYFGETPSGMSPNAFFSTFLKFQKAYNVRILIYKSPSEITDFAC